jgi:Kelch motif
MTSRRNALISMGLSMATVAACGGGGGEAGPPASEPPSPPPPLPAGWVRLADMPAGVAKFGAAALGGKIYVAGGYDTRSGVLVYDIASDRWETGRAMLQGSDNLAVLAAGGKVYAIGGEARTAVQIFDPVANAWSAGPASPAIRFASAAAVLNGRLHLVGGWNYSNTASASVATHGVLDTTTQTWASAAALATARNAAGAATVANRVYVVGGRAPGIRAGDQSPLASVEVYTPGSDSWAAGPALPTARGSLAVAALAERLYAFGGETAGGVVSDAVERLDPVTGLWTTLTAMPYRSHGLGVVVAGDSLYVMGGFTGPSDAVGSESRALYRYTPGAA